MKTGRLINIFIVVLVDLLGFGLILPLLPYYAETFGATPLVIGLLVASYAAASLVGAPILGRLSDRYGRRPILLLSVAGSFLGYMVLGFAAPLGTGLAHLFSSTAINPFIISVLFFSRVLDGLTGGNITVAQAYITDITDESSRSRGLGLIGSAFGLGFIIGPAVGGLLSRWGYNIPALAAAGMALLNLLSIFFTLPESLSSEKRAVAVSQPRPAFTLKALLTALKRPKVGPLLMLRTIIMLAFAIFQSVFALFAQQRLSMSSQSTGFFLTFIGVYSIFVQSVAIGFITRRFKDNAIISASLWLMFIGFIGWAFAPSWYLMLLVILPLSGGGWVLNTIITSTITKVVAMEEIGGMLGISASLESITRVIAPTMGGFLFGSLGYWAPGIAGAVILLGAVWFSYRRNAPAVVPSQALPAEPAEMPPTDICCAEG